MEKYKHSDYVTHINNEEDLVYLKTKHFPVNMRLFNTSPEYKELILAQCNYIRKLALTKMDGYKKPHGLSSANAGLAFNIIGVVLNRNTEHESCKILINPIIKEYLGEIIETTTNCGSVTLKNPIKVNRNTVINVCYYDEAGKIWRHDFGREIGSFTIQHEVDHNNGILIIDK